MATEVKHVTTEVQGRYLLDAPNDKPTLCIVGFHGYRSNAQQLMDDLIALRSSSPWLLCSAQGLSNFYSRSGEIISSWMTKQDREAAISNNISYIDKILSVIDTEYGLPESKFAFTGFSQGAGMAFRASAYCQLKPAMNIIVGGDVPPEIASDNSVCLPTTILCRGQNDKLYPEEQFEKDKKTLSSKSCKFKTISYQGAHEWNDDLFGKLRAEMSKI